MAQAALFVELVPTTKGLSSKVEKEMTDGFSGTEKRGKSLFSKIGGFAKVAGVAVAGAAAAITGLAIKGGFERMLKIEDAQAKLSGLGHSTESVTKIMDSALASVKGTAYGLDTAATVAASTVAAGIKPGKELTRVLSLTADAATIAGIGMDEMGSVFGKVAAKNKLSMREVNQLTERGIPIMQMLAEKYGVTAEEASKMVSSGKIDFAAFAEAIETNVGGAALKSGETTRGAFANMKAALSRVGVALLEGIFPYIQPALLAITGFFDGISSRIKPLMTLLASGEFTTAFREAFNVEEDSALVRVLLFVHDLVKEVAGGFRAMFAAFKDGGDDITSSGLAGFMESIGLAVRKVFDALGPMIGELIKVMPSVSPVVLGFKALWPALMSILPALVDVAKVVGNALVGALKAIAPFLGQFAAMVGDVLVMVLPMVAGLLTQVASVFGKLLGAIMPVVAALLTALMPIFSALVPVVGAILEAVMPLVAGLIDALVPVLMVVVGVLEAVLIPVIDVVVGVINALAAVVTWLVENVVVPYITGILVPTWQALGDGIKWVYDTIIKPVIEFFADMIKSHFDSIAAIFTWLYDNIIEPVSKRVDLAFKLMGAAAEWLYKNGIKPAWDAIGAVMNWLWTQAIKPVLDSVAGGFEWLWKNGIKPVADFINGAVEHVGDVMGDVFGSIGDVIRGGFDGVVGFVRGVMNSIIGVINGVIDGINTVTGLGAAIGINVPQIGHLPRLAAGAYIPAQPGGVAAVIGEGRHDEVVLPLNDDVYKKIRGDDDRNDGATFNIHPPAKSNPFEIARETFRELRWGTA